MAWIFLTFSFIFTTILLSFNRVRARISYKANLQPNCLLTKYPLLFVPGKKSIFYFLKYWNFIPDILSQHGYEVCTLDLPWRNSKKRRDAIFSFLTMAEKMGQKYHLIIDPSSEEEFRITFAKKFFESVASCSLFKTEKTSTEIQTFHYPLNHPMEEISFSQSGHKNSILWTLHQVWTQDNSYSSYIIGYFYPRDVRGFQAQILQRITLLAERDFIFNNTNNNQRTNEGSDHHDRHQNGTFRHQEHSFHIPSTSC